MRSCVCKDQLHPPLLLKVQATSFLFFYYVSHTPPPASCLSWVLKSRAKHPPSAFQNDTISLLHITQCQEVAPACDWSASCSTGQPWLDLCCVPNMNDHLKHYLILWDPLRSSDDFMLGWLLRSLHITHLKKKKKHFCGHLWWHFLRSVQSS